MSEYEEIRVRFAPIDGTATGDPSVTRRFAVDIEASGCDTASVRFELPSHWLAFTTGWRDQGVHRGPVVETAPEPSAFTGGLTLGRELFRALFGPGNEAGSKIYYQVKGRLDRSHGRMRIRLAMNLDAPGIADVAMLPWELMNDDRQQPLSISMESMVVRALDRAVEDKIRPLAPPMRILVVKSSPKGPATLKLDAELALLEKIWSELPDVTYQVVPPRRQEIADELARPGYDYRVLHFMGHGAFDARSGGSLLLEDEFGRPDPIDAKALAAMFKDEPLVLAFLNACSTGETADPTAGDGQLAGVAAELSRDVPAVIAMQYPIGDDAARDFSRTFYKRISQRWAVDEAVTEARKALYSGRTPSWLTPVLYMQTRTGQLFEAVPSHAVRHAMARTAEMAIPVDVAAAEGASTADSAHWLPRVYVSAVAPECEGLRDRIVAACRTFAGVAIVAEETRLGALDITEVTARMQAADLIIHVLGPDTPSRVQPIRDVELGLLLGRAQVVLMRRADLAGVTSADYTKVLMRLRDQKATDVRLQRILDDDAQLIEAATRRVAKLAGERTDTVSQAALATAPAAADPSPTSTAVPPVSAPPRVVIETHEADELLAIDLFELMRKASFEPKLRIQRESDITSEEALRKLITDNMLYVLVSGDGPSDWIANREILAIRAASTAFRALPEHARRKMLLYRYKSPPAGGTESPSMRDGPFYAKLIDPEPTLHDLLSPPGSGAT